MEMRAVTVGPWLASQYPVGLSALGSGRPRLTAPTSAWRTCSAATLSSMAPNTGRGCGHPPRFPGRSDPPAAVLWRAPRWEEASSLLVEHAPQTEAGPPLPL